jgi:hypothetical protein
MFENNTMFVYYDFTSDEFVSFVRERSNMKHVIISEQNNYCVDSPETTYMRVDGTMMRVQTGSEFGETQIFIYKKPRKDLLEMYGYLFEQNSKQPVYANG